MGCYERAVPDPRCYGPRRKRGHTELLAAGIFASRAAAREVRHRPPNIFSFALKLNSITSTCLLTEAERWLQISQSRPPSSSPPLHAICFPFLTRTLCSSARFPPFLTCMSFPQFNSRPFSFLFPLHVSRFLKSGRCYEVLAES